MSQATRATTPAERANIAAGMIRKGKTDSRAFDDCFEMGDATQVVAYLLAKAVTDERIAAFARRCVWTVGVGGSSRDPNPIKNDPTPEPQGWDGIK